MLKNLNTMDRYIKIAGGISLVAFGAARYGKKDSFLSKVLVVAGAMKVAEGITGFDPVLAMMGRKSIIKKVGVF